MAIMKRSSTNILLRLDKTKMRLLIGVIIGYCILGKMGGKWVAKIADFFRLCPRVKEIGKWLI